MTSRAALSRRQMLGSIAAFAATRLCAQLNSVIPSSNTVKRETVESLIRPLFQTDNPALFKLAVDVYQECILGKLRAPEPPFRFSWLLPGGVYVGQWLWDTTFVTDLLAILPDQRDILRGVYQNYWDFCDRWNAVQPEYAHGMVANVMQPFSHGGRTWRTFPAYSQAPLLAWGVERVFKRTQDLELVRTALPYLEAFHDWYWRERDVTNVGLIGVGSYSSVTQEARYETYDFEVDLDTLHLTAHPHRHGSNEGMWYGDILIPANTAYLIISEDSLSRLATAAGDLKMVERRRNRRDKGRLAMRQHMWDSEAGCFLAVRRDTLEKIDSPTVGGFTPLMAGAPTVAQAARMAEALTSPAWDTPLPIPTVSRTNKAFNSKRMWRGDVWPTTVYQVATGLAAYGRHELAAHLAGGILDNAIRVGISERYDSVFRRPLGVAGLGMSCVSLTMALDGLSPDHRISVRQKQS